MINKIVWNSNQQKLILILFKSKIFLHLKSCWNFNDFHMFSAFYHALACSCFDRTSYIVLSCFLITNLCSNILEKKESSFDVVVTEASGDKKGNLDKPN